MRPVVAQSSPCVLRIVAQFFHYKGGVWHKASVLGCLPLALPIGLLPLLILTLCGPERVLVVSTEPLDDLSCLTTPGVSCPGDGLLPVPLTRCIQMHTPGGVGGWHTPGGGGCCYDITLWGNARSLGHLLLLLLPLWRQYANTVALLSAVGLYVTSSLLACLGVGSWSSSTTLVSFVRGKTKPLISTVFFLWKRPCMPLALVQEASWGLGSTPGHPSRPPSEPKH